MTKSNVFKLAHAKSKRTVKYNLYGRQFDTYAEAFAQALKDYWHVYRLSQQKDEEKEIEQFYARYDKSLRAARMMD